MKHKITKLTPIETQLMVDDFLKSIGTRLKNKRTIKSVSQEELANCLDIDQSTLSKYEKGSRDMPISLLPKFSTYCKFPLYELFPKDESQHILETFSKAVEITVERRKRHIEKQTITATDKVLKGQVYDIDGKEIFEPIVKKTGSKSLRMRYKDAEMHTEFSPYTESEFCDFVKNNALLNSVLDAGNLLMQIDDKPHKDTLKGAIADYIIDELIINQVAHRGSEESERRAYAYYRELYQLFLNGQ